ncbi:MAG: cell division protein SepF [bacterium]
MPELGIIRKIVSFFSFESDDNDMEEAGVYRDKEEKIVPMGKRMRQTEISIYQPHSYDDAQRIADSLKSGKAVIVNLCRLDVELGKRVVDFVSGIVYALEGCTRKVGENIFVFTPSNISLSPDDNSGAEASGSFLFHER